MAMTPEELRRETGTGETVPYKDMFERIRNMGPAAIGGIVIVGFVLYGLYRWVTY